MNTHWQQAAMPSLVLAAALVFAGCSSTPVTHASASPDPSAASLALRTSAFKPGGNIPKKFTCEGPNVSPALDWDAPPSATRSFALIMDDPDAPSGTWVHWVVYDLSTSTRHLLEGVSKGDALEDGGRQGVNDFGDTGYGGPCPPPGKPHRYFFKLYALDKPLGLGARARKPQVESAMKGHILAQGELIGRFGR
jgi:Raf kinase inhibitor-like YbhB/YbcL family protein